MADRKLIEIKERILKYAMESWALLIPAIWIR